MRTNTNKRTKYYDEMVVNGWDLKFEYETENGTLLPSITVNGVKNQQSTLMIKKDANQQLQTIFNRSDYDNTVVVAVMDEFSAIVVEHAPPAN
ncbi:hypothetical protein H7F33_05470 [Pedobacter sp. PAMC26386]|nr:hypothetical protein H7F33_05470 [Pedobacter sp. PAMC26386]